MDVETADAAISSIAAAIGETARAKMLYRLADGHARTSTELAAVADVTASTASVHLQRLKAERLVKVIAQGKCRYYSLASADVAAALEALSVLAGAPRAAFVPTTPVRLRAARTCYDHIAGTLGVNLHDRFVALEWIRPVGRHRTDYDLTTVGVNSLERIGVDVSTLRTRRRRFAFACLDWSERRPHLGGALGAALLEVALKKKWVEQDLDSRSLELTAAGHREMRARFGLHSS